MSEESPRRSSHRAAGPVDAGTYVRREVDPNLSPRRRARMMAEVAEQKSSAATQPITEGAKDLLTSWLKANGFEDLEAFQEMTRKADSQLRQTSLSGQELPLAAAPAPPAETPPPALVPPEEQVVSTPFAPPVMPAVLPRRSTRVATQQPVQTPAPIPNQLGSVPWTEPANLDVT